MVFSLLNSPRKCSGGLQLCLMSPCRVQNSWQQLALRARGTAHRVRRTCHLRRVTAVCIARDAQRPRMAAGRVVVATDEAAGARQLEAQPAAARRAHPRVWPVILRPRTGPSSAAAHQMVLQCLTGKPAPGKWEGVTRPRCPCLYTLTHCVN